MPEPRIRRTLLLTPGHRATRLVKAVSLAVDAVAFDLEDGVPPPSKGDARRAVASGLRSLPFGRRERVVRVNAVGTTDLVEDLRALPLEALDSLFIPKVRSAADVRMLEVLLRGYEAAAHRPNPLPLILTIETAEGLSHAASIATASPRAAALFFGSGDYAADTGCALTPEALHVPRSLIAAAAAAAKLQAIDAAFFRDVRDADATRADALAARALGFSGKVVFHPNQVEPVNAVFTPTPDEVARARGVVAAYEAALARGDGVVLAEGEFVSIDTVLIMRRVLAAAAHAGVPGA